MRFSFAIAVSCTAATAAATVPAVTMSTMNLIMNDFSKLGNQFNEIAADVNSFPQTGINGVNDIHANAGAIHTLFLDVNNTLDNVKKIVSTYNSFTPDILDYLDGITDQAADFKFLGSSASTISLELLNAVQPCVQFGNTVMSIIPPVMTDEANTMFIEVDVARQNAIAALS